MTDGLLFTGRKLMEHCHQAHRLLPRISYARFLIQAGGRYDAGKPVSVQRITLVQDLTGSYNKELKTPCC